MYVFVAEPFVEDSIFLLNNLGSFVKNQLIISMGTLFPVELTYMSVLTPIPQCLDNCNFILILEMKQCKLSSFKIKAILGSMLCRLILESPCQFLHKYLLSFSFGFHGAIDI